MKRGCLIVFTGIDGSGKTTQAKLLVESLRQDGKKIFYAWSRWEPFLLRPLIRRWKQNLTKDAGASSSSYDMVKDKKRKLLSNPVFRWVWLTAFIIDYGLQLFIKIRIKLLARKLLVSDRIFYDSIIDQAINLDQNKDILLNRVDSFWLKIFFPHPDMVIFIDCPGNIAFYRKNDAPNIEYLENRRRLYLELSDKYGWIKLDGTLPVDEIAVQIKKLVYKRLSL